MGRFSESPYHSRIRGFEKTYHEGAKTQRKTAGHRVSASWWMYRDDRRVKIPNSQFRANL